MVAMNPRRLFPGILLLLLICGCGGSNEAVQLVFGYAGSFSGRGSQPDSLQQPYAVLPLGNGTFIREVWVAEVTADRISRFDFDGRFLRTFLLSGGPVALAQGSDSSIYVALEFSRRVAVVDTSGAVLMSFAVADSFIPYGIAATGGRIDVSELYELSGGGGQGEGF